MQRVSGIGGIFFRADDPAGLGTWYREHLGVPVEENGHAVFPWHEADSEREGMTVWSIFDRGDAYFPTGQSYMINYRVDDLDAMLAQLRAAGVAVDDRVEDYPYGRFGWITDPAGNRIELWQPLP